MQTITQKQLKEKYGLDFPKGNYAFEIQGNKYKVYAVKDDTEGCLLLGLNKVKGSVINSQNAVAFFMDRTPDTFDLEII